jgi:hypothetical protein
LLDDFLPKHIRTRSRECWKGKKLGVKNY